ncbi:phosphoribosylanthranilate isomerase [Arcticibacter pallidicorallinus]|uniref:N-(5'-phosphoribosyl)anthranilate isomerase n=1 Tax=Arcticibacter pallidicorallinus TaxID=1259464 RepID=A0A2T0TYY3_9SPHI|nr:phosphoribosylanthranilate isomerase [Arcticibacter pallidicorallinus]PRY50884.1 phosphoribosylanthranilate isomerase [Arcticibacter pallidicorallinus]
MAESDNIAARPFKIKVCGMKDAHNIPEVASLSPDYLGFIFYAPSARYAAEVDPQILRNLPAGIKKTGVFVNEVAEQIKYWVDKMGLDAVQLHGAESPAFCREIGLLNVETIKAFGVDEHFDFKTLDEYTDSVDYFLFDTKTPAHGGSGKLFDWKLLQQNKTTKPFFLSGGIDIQHLDEIRQIDDSRLYAIDVNSRFEISPGMKDYKKLEAIFK